MFRAVPHARVAYFVWRRFRMCRLRGSRLAEHSLTIL
jgi:hypothetical protein